MAQLLLPLSRLGFLLAISMGFLLFSADAAHVVRNPAFQAKLLLIAAALINIVIAHPARGGGCALARRSARRRQSRRAGVAAAVARRRLRRAPDRIFLTGSAVMDRIRFAIFTILLGLCAAADIASADEAERPGPRCALAGMSP